VALGPGAAPASAEHAQSDRLAAADGACGDARAATAVFLGQFLATFVLAYLARVTDFAGTFTAIALASVAVALSALVTKVAFGMA